MRGFQDSTLKVFCELGDALATRTNEFGDGLRQIFVVRIQSVAPQYSMRSGVAVGDAGVSAKSCRFDVQLLTRHLRCADRL
jgi:hypothetical protein